MKKVIALVVFAYLHLGTANQAVGQTHFTECVTSTGDNATILINDAINPLIDGSVLSVGDEIAVYTTEGLCAGVEVWTGENIALTAWGDNSLTTEKDGLSANEQMNFVVWDASTQTEYGNGYGNVLSVFETEAPYNSSGLYDQDAIYLLTQFSAAAPQAPNAIIIASTTVGDAPLIVSFDGGSSFDEDGSIISYTWIYGDGTSGTGTTTSHTYSTSGVYTATLTVTDNSGLTATDSETITVNTAPQNSPPTASFTASPTSGTVPVTTIVDGAQSSDTDGSIVSYSWAFGDGSTGSGVSSSHQYSLAGTYGIVLTVTDNEGATATATQTVVVSTAGNVPPVASFSMSPASGIAPLSTSFDASSSTDSDGNIIVYTWDFGNEQTGSGVNTSTIYATSGTYTVRLTVTDNSGAMSSTTQVVSVSNAPVNSAPVSSFVASTSSGPAPLAVTFDGAGSSDEDGTISSYAWTFGDGSTGQEAAASHTFTQAGTYSVVLVVTDNDGATGSSQQTIVVSNIPSNSAPVATFTASTTVGTAPHLVTFDASGSTDSDGTIDSYSWVFGDGVSGSGVSSSHTFIAAGTFSITLTVTDNAGATDQTSQVVTVSAEQAPDSLVMHLTFDEVSGQNAFDLSGNSNNGTLVSGAAFSTSQGIIDGAVRLDGQNSYVDIPDAPELNQAITAKRTIAVWFNADDISISSKKQIIYEEGGQQKGLSLYLFDSRVYIGGWNKADSESGWDGTFLSSPSIAANTWHHLVFVLDGGPTVTTGALAGYLDGQEFDRGVGSQLWAHYDDIGIGGVDGDTWFHDATNREGLSHGLSGYLDDLRVYNYPLNPGEILALASSGSSPNQVPVAQIQSDQESGVAPLTINFSGDTSTDSDGSIVSYAWSFGEGSTSSGASVSQTFTTPGMYTVELTVTDNLGGTDTASKAIVVNGSSSGAVPTAEIREGLSRQNSMSISLSATMSSDPDGTIQGYSWLFGDGESGTGSEISHEYDNPGAFEITLVVTDNDGLSSQTKYWASAYRDLPEMTGSSLIGSTALNNPGYANLDGDVLTISAPAAIRTDELDVLRFVHETVKGDGSLTIRLNSSDATFSAARIGVMIRSQLTPAATMVELSIDPTGSVELASRVVSGVAKTVEGSGDAGSPGWIRITRQDKVFRGYASSDGIVWGLIGSVEVGMPETVFMGITASTRNGQSFVAELDNLEYQSIEDEFPDGYLLSEAYPNPFNPSSQLTLIVDKTQNVVVDVYNMTGERVQRLFKGEVLANQSYEYRFVAADVLASGMYLFRVRGETFGTTRKVILIK